MSSYEKSVGYRFQEWSIYDEEKLTAAEKAHALDTFAAEFDSMPASQEPHSGWGATMADLCRRSARRHRGEPVGE